MACSKNPICSVAHRFKPGPCTQKIGSRIHAVVQIGLENRTAPLPSSLRPVLTGGNIEQTPSHSSIRHTATS